MEHISDALIKVDPDNREFYVRNREEYLRNLYDLDLDIRKNLSEIKNRKFMVFHPAWGYFARDYVTTHVLENFLHFLNFSHKEAYFNSTFKIICIFSWAKSKYWN
ncbi:MAG: zinc ABC transporter substrate-binding protein, partial [Euryarchaeota archaeon]|nr:zinc ABC transporter substrate-binding protein [Euryarchaeota archaeon]